MRGTILARQAGAVEAEDHRQMLNRGIVHDVIERTLEESRVDRADRTVPFGSHPRGKRDSVSLGNADVVEPIGQFLGELYQPGTGRHGGGDGDDTRVALGKLHQRFAKHILVVRRFLDWDGALFDRLGLGFHTVPLDRVGLGGYVPSPLAGDHVQQHRFVEFFGPAQNPNDILDVVTVDRTNVFESEIFKECPRHDQIAQRLFQPMYESAQLLGKRRVLHRIPDFALDAVVERVGQHVGQIARQRADILRD